MSLDINNTSLSNKPWRMYRIPDNQIEHIIPSAPGIFIGEKREESSYYHVAVNNAHLPWLIFHEVNFGLVHDPTEPLDAEIRVHGESRARRIADARFLQDAVQATCSGHDRGLELCYRNITPSRLRVQLEWAVLSRDVLQSSCQIRTRFSQYLVFLGLNLLNDYDSRQSHNLLEKDQTELLGPCWKHLEFLILPSKNFSCSHEVQLRPANPRLEFQTISLLRCLLDFSGASQDCWRSASLDPECKVNDNANLYGSFLGISVSNWFGNFESQKLIHALSKSKVFTSSIDVVRLSIQMISALPIGFERGLLGLPVEVLHKFTKRQMDEIRAHTAHIYHCLPSLNKSANNASVFLIWSSIANGVPQIVSEWAVSDDGSTLRKQLIRAVADSQTTEQLALTLAALLCFQQLLHGSSNYATQPTRGFFLAEFDAVLDGEPLGNERAVFERMVFSFLWILGTLKEDYQDLYQIFATVLDIETPILDFFDGFSDQYLFYRIEESLSHKDAFKRTRQQAFMEKAMRLAPDDEDWVMLKQLRPWLLDN